MPIFIALYQALQYSVDLRLAPFLYFKNLAAPDALFKLPFVVPWLGWTTFNLLPIITVALMVVQQKMFMPPPTDEQQEMQQKMMSYMMVVMGAMFYKFPSGLCVYYISSSLWGFGERKLLTWWKPTTTAPPGTVAPAAAEDAPATGRGKPARTEPEPPGRVAARPGHSGRSCSTQPMRPTPTPPRARKPASRAAANRPANATANARARFLSGGTGGLSVSVFVFEFVGCDKTAFAAAGTPFLLTVKEGVPTSAARTCHTLRWQASAT